MLAATGATAANSSLLARQVPDKTSAHGISAGVNAACIGVVRGDQIINHRTGVGQILFIVAVGFPAEVISPTGASFENIRECFGIHRDEPFRLANDRKSASNSPPLALPPPPWNHIMTGRFSAGVKVCGQVQQIPPRITIYRQVLE